MEAALTGVLMSRPNKRAITCGNRRAARWKSISEHSRSVPVTGLAGTFCVEALNILWAWPFASWSSLIAHNGPCSYFPSSWVLQLHIWQAQRNPVAAGSANRCTDVLGLAQSPPCPTPHGLFSLRNHSCIDPCPVPPATQVFAITVRAPLRAPRFVL